MSDQVDALFDTFRPSPFTSPDPNQIQQEQPSGPGNPNPVGFIAPGAVTPGTFDTTPPAVPTGLTVTSDTGLSADGLSVVRLIVTLTPPADTDYFGSYIEVTADNDGAPSPTPVWTQPMKLLLGAGTAKVAFEGVRGNTTYWVRAYAIDIQGNKSAFTSPVSYRTVKDADAPAQPQSVVAVAGFEGVALSWNQGTASDLQFYQVRWGTDGVDFPDIINARATKIWVPDLIAGTLYYFQVRAVDTSGNVVTSAADSTPVDFLDSPDAGWTTAVTATPSQVGSSDIAANSITTAHIATAGLDADVIRTGELDVRPSGGATAIKVYDSGGVLQGSWDPTNGIKIFAADASNYAAFDDAYLRFYKAGILQAEMGPDGIKADSIRLGVLSGGHNLILNSSFELAGFITGTSAPVIFTDNSGTPAWKAANRTTAPDNITEGASDLTATLAY